MRDEAYAWHFGISTVIPGQFLGRHLFLADLLTSHEPDAVSLVEAGILPASEGGILPPGWKPGDVGAC